MTNLTTLYRPKTNEFVAYSTPSHLLSDHTPRKPLVVCCNCSATWSIRGIYLRVEALIAGECTALAEKAYSVIQA